MMRATKTRAARYGLLAFLAAAVFVPGIPFATAPAQAASEVAIVVNNQAITTGDIQRRTAFLRLQRDSGNLNEKAREQLINETIQLGEAARIGAVASEAQVDQAVQRFADSNNLSMDQVRQIFSQAGVGIEHFRRYLRVQISWPRVVNARYAAAGSSSGNGMSQQELVSRMLERGGDQPSTTEYILQQIIFVVPDDRRGAILGQRRNEAEQMRSRFSDCGSTRQTAASLRDVSVRELGRIMQPELPPDWRDQIIGTSAGQTTTVRTTERGVEFIAVCQAREVSDDRAAEVVFSQQDEQSSSQQENSERFLQELKSRSAISYR